MHLSETARDVKHRQWAVVLNRRIYYISQGTVETPIRRGGQFCCSFVANLLQYLSTKNYQNTMRFDKVITKIKGCNFFGLTVYYVKAFRNFTFHSIKNKNTVTKTSNHCKYKLLEWHILMLWCMTINGIKNAHNVPVLYCLQLTKLQQLKRDRQKQPSAHRISQLSQSTLSTF